MSWYRRRPRPASDRPAPSASIAAHEVRVPPIRIAESALAPEPIPADPSGLNMTNRPDTVVDGWSTDAVTLRAVSSRGHSHRFQGAPRQDDYSVLPIPGTEYVAIAVADGVSSAPHSHIGSTTAARYATAWLSQALAESDLADIDWDALVEHTCWSLLEQAKRLLPGEDPLPEHVARLVATTLICCVVGPGPDGSLHGRGVSVGDCQIKVLTSTGFDDVTSIEKLGEGGISSSAVHALPASAAAATPLEFAIWPDETLLIGSDGIWDALGSGDGELGNMFRDLFSVPHPTLVEFARAVDFVKDSFDDDRTLVGVWPRPAGDPAAVR